MKYKYVKTNNISSKTENDSPVKNTTEEKSQVITEEILDFVIDVNSQGDISGKREYNKNSSQNTEKQEDITQQVEISNEVENPSSLSNNTKTEKSFLNKFKDKKLFSKKGKNTSVSLEKLDIDFKDNSYNDNEVTSVELFEETSENLETIEEKSTKTSVNEKKSFLSKFKKEQSLPESNEVENLEINTVQEEAINTDITIENINDLDNINSQSNSSTKNKLSIFSKLRKNKKSVDLKDIEEPLELSEDEIESAINLFKEEDDFTHVDLNKTFTIETTDSSTENIDIFTNNQEKFEEENNVFINSTETDETLNSDINKDNITIPRKKSLFDKFKKEKTKNLSSPIQLLNTDSIDIDKGNSNLIIEDTSFINETEITEVNIPEQEIQFDNQESLKETNVEVKNNFDESNILKKLDIPNNIIDNDKNSDSASEPEFIFKEENNIDIINTETENSLNNEFVEDNIIVDTTIEVPEKKEKVSFFNKFKKKKANNNVEEINEDFILQTNMPVDITSEKEIDNTVIDEIDSIEETNNPILENISNNEEIEIIEESTIDTTIEVSEKKEKVSFFNKFKKKKANNNVEEINEDFLLQANIPDDSILEKEIDNTVIDEINSIEGTNNSILENISNNEEIEIIEESTIDTTIEVPEKKEKISFFNKFKKKKTLDEFSFDTQSSNNDNSPQINTFKEDIYLQKEIDNSIINESSEIIEETGSAILDDIIDANPNILSKEEIFDKTTDNEDFSPEIVDETIEVPEKKEKVSLFDKFKKEQSITLTTIEKDTPNEEITISEEDKENVDLGITETDLVDNAFTETAIKKEKKPFFGLFKKEKSRSLDELDEITNDTQKEILNIQDIDDTELFETINVKKEEKKKEKSSLFTINKPKKQEKPEIELSYDRFNELGEDFISEEEELSSTNNFEIDNTVSKQKNKFALPAFLTGLSFGKKNKSKQLIEETFDLQEDTENLTIQSTQNFDNNFSELNVNDENSLFGTNNTTDNASLFEDNSNLSNTSLPNQQMVNGNNTISLNKKSLLLILLAIILIVTFTTVLTSFIISKLIVSSPEPTVVENTIDQEAIDKAVQEALNKMNYFNEINNTTSKVDTPVSNNDKELELPPQLGIDFETSNIEENKSNIALKMFNLGNFSFSYPMEWVENMSFSLKPTPENVSNIVMLGVDNDSLKHVNNMRVTTENLIQAISAKEYVEKTEQVLKENYTNFKLRNSKELTVSGREAPTRIYSYEQNGENYFQYQIYVADKTKIYIITFTSSARLFEDNYKIYNQILETIRI